MIEANGVKMRIINCERKPPKRHRVSLSITIDPHILEALKKWMEREDETNLSSVIEGFIDCGVRDTCEGCPSYEELPQKKKVTVGKKAGVGKWERK
jgi:hypothetical protein